MEPKILHRERVYSGWSSLDRVALRMPNGGVEERHIEDHGSAAAVLPYDPLRKVAIMVRQPRAVVVAAGEAPALEAPAGKIEDEDPQNCARREVLEETGVRVGHLTKVARIWSMPSVSTEILHLYLATYGPDDRLHAGGGLHDENEGIEVVEVSLAELARLARSGALQDAKTLILIQRLMLDLPDLFQ